MSLVVNDVTNGKRFTIGASVYHSDWEGRGVGQDTSSIGHKKPGAGPGYCIHAFIALIIGGSNCARKIAPTTQAIILNLASLTSDLVA